MLSCDEFLLSSTTYMLTISVHGTGGVWWCSVVSELANFSFSTCRICLSHHRTISVPAHCPAVADQLTKFCFCEAGKTQESKERTPV